MQYGSPPPPPGPPYQPGPYGQNPYPAPPRKAGMALPAFVMGIIGLVLLPVALFCCPVLSAPFSLLGIVLGSMAKGEIGRDPSLDGAQQARIGLITGAVGLGLLVLLYVVIFVVFGVAIATSEA